MASVDSLSIRIAASTKTAVKNVNSLADALKGLASALDSINPSGLENVVRAVSSVANSSAGLKTTTKNITTFANGMNKVGQSAGNVAKATSAVEGTGSAAAKAARSTDNAAKAISKFSDEGLSLTKVSNAFQKIGLTTPTKALKKLETQASNVRKEYEQLRQNMRTSLENGTMASGGNEYNKQVAQLQKVKEKYGEIIAKQQELAASGGAFQINPNLSRYFNAFKSGFTSVTNIVKKGLLAGLKAVTSHMRGFGKATKSASHSAKGLVKEITRIGKMLKLMVTRMVLRKVIEGVLEGFKNLTRYSSTFDSSISMLWNDMRQLGNAIASAVSPLLNAFAPALHYIIQLVIKAVNAINQLLSALMGFKTWTKAKTLTDSYGDSLDKAGKKAKALKKTVLGFDELNQLQDNDSGGGGTDPKDMFEEIEIPKKWLDIAKWLKDMWAKADFTELGKLLGKKLKDALDKIPWAKIYSTAQKLGKSLATLINGFISTSGLGNTIGKTIAKALNAAVAFLNQFVKTLDWKGIGTFIADTFNGFFENIKWNWIYDTVVQGLSGVATAINSFIDTFHWDNISNTIINGINIVTAGVKAFFEKIKWKKLGNEIGKQINKSIKGIKWRDIGKTLGSIIQAAVDFLSGIVKNLNVKDCIKAISDMIKGFFEKVDTAEAGKTIGDLIQKLIDIIQGVWEENGDLIKSNISSFFTGIISQLDMSDVTSIIGTILGAAFLAGVGKIAITGAVDALTTVVKNMVLKSIGAKVVSDTAASTLGSTLSTAVGSSTVTSAGTAAGASLGSTIFWAVAEFLSVHALTNEIMQMVAPPEDAELYKQYSGLFGFFKELKDVGVGVWDLISMKVEDSTRVHVEMTEQQRQALERLRAKAEETKGTFDKIYDTKAAEGLKKMKDRADELKESLTHIQDTKAAEGFSNLHHIAKDAADGINTLSIEVEKDTPAIQTATGTWSDFFIEVGKAVAGKATLNDVTEAFKNIRGAVDEDVDELQALIKESHEANAIKFTPLSESVKSASASFGICDTKAAEAFKTMSDGAKNTDLSPIAKSAEDTEKKTSTAFKNTAKNVEVVTVELPKAMSTAGTSISGTVQTLSKSVDDETKKGFDAAGKNSKVFVDDMPKDVTDAQKTMSDSVETLNKDFDTNMGDVKKTVQDTTDDINKNLDTIKDGMTEDKWTFSGISDGLKKSFEAAKEAIKGVWNSIAEKLNGDYQIGDIKLPIHLPTFAGGGFPENGLFMANSTEMVGRFSNGRTAVANNEQITNGIAQAVFNAITSANAQGGNEKYINNTIYIDDVAVARAVTKGQEKLNRRYSPTMA